MIKFGLLVLTLFFSFNIHASEGRIVSMLNQVSSSLEHIQSAEVSASQTIMDETGHNELAYHIFIHEDSHATARIKHSRDQKIFVKNPRGSFLVLKGVPINVDGSFPLDLPTNFLDHFAESGITENFKFKIREENTDSIQLDVLPAFAVKRTRDEAVVTMLQFNIKKSPYLLTNIHIFENYQLLPSETLLFKYDFLPFTPYDVNSLQTLKKPFLTQFTHITHNLETKDREDFVRKEETRYHYIDINPKLDMDIFDEEDY